jgi:hypothetical protein
MKPGCSRWHTLLCVGVLSSTVLPVLQSYGPLFARRWHALSFEFSEDLRAQHRAFAFT